MLPAVKLNLSGLLDSSTFDAWSNARRLQIRNGTAQAMREGGRPIAAALNGQVQRNYQSKKRFFTNQFRVKVYDQKPDRLPMLMVRSKIPWMGLATRGGVIRGPLLVPLIKVGTRAFRNILNTIMRTGAGFFKKVNGKVFLFAEYQPEYGAPFRRFTRAERKRLGTGRIKRGADIPIAVMVPRVEVKKRIDLQGAVRPRLPALAALIKQRITQG